MFCGKCGVFVPPQNHFCTKCGTPITQAFQSTPADDYHVIKIKDKNLDYTNHGELVTIFERTKDKMILIDLSVVDFIDSVGVGGLVTLVYKTNRTKQEIKFIITSEKIMKAISALGVDNVLDIYENEQDARASWGLTPV